MSDFTEDLNGYMWTGVLLGTIGSLSSESWPCVWMMIELNLMSFLPLLTSTWNFKKVTMIYFIVQSVGSLTILTRVINDRASLIRKVQLFGLILKSSLAPIHFWGPVIIVNLNKRIAFVFLTWQKLAPIFLLLAATSTLLTPLILLNTMVAATMVYGSKDLFIIMFFSRISHIGWVLAAPYSLSCGYFFLYSVITAPIFLCQIKGINLPLLFFNLGGLPPFTGFFLKLRVFQALPNSFISLLMVLSIPLLFAYLRMFLSSAYTAGVSATTLIIISIGIIL